MIRRKSFDPRSAGTLALWLDAADAQALGTWSDKSGNGRTATQLATNNQPAIATNAIGNRTALYFDGVNDSLSLPVLSMAGWHAFVACKPATSSTQTVLYIASSSTQSFKLSSSASGVAVLTASGSPTTSTQATYGVDGRIGAGWDGGALKAFFTGHIGEILVYSAALSAGQASAVSRYLAAKWGA